MAIVTFDPSLDPSTAYGGGVVALIVNWNKKRYLLRLLDSLDALPQPLSVLVVDNASTDGSPEAALAAHPRIELIRNSRNLGGTGGFNTGLRWVLERAQAHRYVWMLDNDADIDDTTLEALVATMEADPAVGVAGSRIVDIDDHSVTVELGATFRWDTIGVEPVLRNVKELAQVEDVREVDYVAVCSALVRMEALRAVGPMDERMFIFWDDMDWGLCFKEKGWKVVAVPGSVAYHGSFTERRRGVLTGFYYGTRNALLVYSKHTPPLRRLRIFYRYMRYFCKGMLFLLLTGHGRDASLAIRALSDFCASRWGQYSGDPVEETSEKDGEADPRVLLQGKTPRNILIVAGDTRPNILRLRDRIRKVFPDARLTLLVEDDRVELFKDQFNDVVLIETTKRASLLYNAVLFVRLALSGFEVVFTPNTSPYTFALRSVIAYDADADTFRLSANNLLNIYKPLAATLLGEAASVLLTPYVLIKSLKY